MRLRALWVTLVGLVCLAAPLALSPGAALAAPPVFASITVTGGQATVKWSLPPCVQTILVETATDKTTNQRGYFPDQNVYSFDTPSATDTSLVITDTKDLKPGNFPPGTYYVHVGGQDTSRPPPILPEFSDAVQFTVDRSGNGGASVSSPFPTPPCPTGSGSGGGGGGGAGIVTKVAPFGSLIYPRIQSIRTLFVVAHSNEAGTLRAAGSVSVPGAAKVYRFKPVSRKVGAFASVKLRLRLSKRDLLAVKRALKKKGARLKAKITVMATNSAGIARSQRATVKLKR
jgi:hypothetical protein